MAADLVFRQTPLGGSPVDLVFGEAETSADAFLTVVATMPALTATVSIAPPFTDLTIVATMPAMTLVAHLGPPLPVSGVFGASAGAPWRAAGGLQATLVPPWRDAGPAEAAAATGWAPAQSDGPQVRKPWGNSEQITGEPTRAPWQQAARAEAQAGLPWQQFLQMVGVGGGSWRDAARADWEPFEAPWQQAYRRESPFRVPFRQGSRNDGENRAAWRQGALQAPGHRTPWRDGVRLVSFGGPLPPVPPIEPPVNDCYEISGDLVFQEGPGGLDLVFKCDYAAFGPVIVPVRSVYIVINTVTLTRVTGNLALPVLGLSMSLDSDSWTWGFSATLPAASLADLAPVNGQPVELQATINGVSYRLLAESLSRNREFARSTITVRGRAKNATLDAPYSPVKSFDNAGAARTAAQLMDDVLTLNGQSIGWAVDFGLTDWLVPAGAWAYQGSYIDGLKRIAEAGGGYLQPHPTANTIQVKPLYPVVPWDWDSADADYELPSAAVRTESIEWVDKALYNRVFVSGQGTGGVLGQVTRTGTAGDLVAPMVTDALITHVDAARQRGTPILADTGRQARITLSLPVLPETGIIAPGKFVRYVDGATTRYGIVRSTQVEASGQPELWQTLGVETHE